MAIAVQRLTLDDYLRYEDGTDRSCELVQWRELQRREAIVFKG